MVKKIAIIPARGNSQRIKKKNIVEFKKKPLIYWTIKAAIESNVFSRIIVSTDNKEIAKISRNFGAEVPFLRDKYNDSYTSSSIASLYALKQAEEFYKTKFEITCQLMPTCPLRSANDIRNAFDSYSKNKRDFQISVVKFNWLNPWWALKLDSYGNTEQLFPNKLMNRSQDLPNLFCPTGAIWIANSSLLKESKTFYGNGYKIEPLQNWFHGIDIDNFEDLKMAETFDKSF